MIDKAELRNLKDSPLLAGMTENDFNGLSAIFQEKEIAEGMTVFIENMPGESLYLIREGTIKISRMLAEGEEKILVILGPEDVFGEMAIIGEAPRSATARVAEKARLLSIRKDDFDQFCEENPKLALKLLRNLMRVFSQRVRESNDEYREMLLWSLNLKS